MAAFCVSLLLSLFAASADGALVQVTDEYVPHWMCVEQCGALGGGLACPATDAENALVVAAAQGPSTTRFSAKEGFDVWIGAFKNAAGFWGCAGGDALPSLTWAEGEPAVAAFECAHLARADLRKRGKWVSALCSEEHRCVCDLNARSSNATSYDRPRLEANAAIVAAEDFDQLILMIVVAGSTFLGVYLLSFILSFVHLYRVAKRHELDARTALDDAPSPDGARPQMRREATSSKLTRQATSPTLRRQSTAGDLRRQSTDNRINAASPEGGAAEMEVAEDDLVASAETTLNAARDASARLRVFVTIAAMVGVAIALLILLPLGLAQFLLGWNFGIAGCGIVLLNGFATPLLLDPMIPRKVRTDTGAIAFAVFPMFAALFGCLGPYFLLTPTLLGLCSTRTPTCALASNWMAGSFLVLALSFAVLLTVFLPILYKTRDAPLPPLKEMLKQQKTSIAEDGATHLLVYRPNPLYLLEGAGYFAMPIRTSIDRFCRNYQILGLFAGACLVVIVVAMDTCDVSPTHFTRGSLLPMGLSFLIGFPVSFSGPFRRAVAAYLGRLGSKVEARQAAAVAGLLGGLAPAKALAIGKASFRGLSFSALNDEDLATNKDTGLNQRTTPLALGKCDAFMSHSWHDDAGIKWAKLEAWAARFEADHKRSPILWLDKACIDQQNISASLACLPVYLAGCQRLLVLAGPTYIERLWCIIECFTFFQMGGELERVEIVPLGDAIDFNRFDVEHAKCFDQTDKAKLLTAIESAFGAYAPFNALIRSMLANVSGGEAPALTKGRADQVLPNQPNETVVEEYKSVLPAP